MAEHIKIINSFVKKPPAEKLLTNSIPAASAVKKIITPHKRPVFMPFLRRLLAAVYAAAKQPAHSAPLDISAKVPSDRSITDANPENTDTARKTAPTQARAAYSTVSSFSFLSLSAGVLRINLLLSPKGSKM